MSCIFGGKIQNWGPAIFSVFTEFSQYMPHGMCLLWEPWLLVLWAGSDLIIVGAYFAIPVALLRVLAKRNDIKHRGLILLFASFILLCGVTHALSVVTLWMPIYPLQGVVKLVTGIVSATTAVVLFKLVPTLVSIPSLNDMEDANRKLLAEVAAHKQTMSVLREARDELELKVARRTAELRDVNDRLSITAREAVHRSHNLISVITAMARQSARAQTDVAEFTNVFIGRLSALADATGAVIRSQEQSSVDLRDVVLKQLEPVTLTYPDKIQVEGPHLEIDAEAAQQMSLAVHELATNAQKYGSLASDQARISVTYSVQEAEPGQKRLVVVWQEDLPQVATEDELDKNKKGFGSRLLTQIIPTMLSGEASRTLSDGRLTYKLDVPLSAVTPNQIRTGNEAFAGNVVDGNFGEA